MISLIIFTGHTSDTYANIYRDGVCIYSVDLSTVHKAYELDFTDEHGSNTVRIEPGRICVTDANCPDSVCINSGWITDSAAPIVCLPHRLVIRIEKKPNDTITPDTVSK